MKKIMPCLYIFAAILAFPLPNLHGGEGRISDAEARLELARILARETATRDDALRHYRRLLEANPDSPALHLETGEVKLRMGDFIKGVHHLEKAASLDPGAMGITSRVCGLMMEFGAFYRAETLYRNFWEENPGATEIALALADLMAASDRFPDAEGIYSELLLREEPPGRLVLEAIAHLRLLEHRPETAAGLAGEILREHPRDPQWLRIKAQALDAMGKYDQATELYEKLLGLDTEERNADTKVELGRLAGKKKEAGTARQWFERALEAAPSDARVLFYFKDQHTDPAPNFWEAAPDYDVNPPEDFIVWGELYRNHGFPQNAVASYRKALEADELAYVPRRGLALALAQANRYDEALSVLERLDEDFPENYQVLIAMARISGWKRDYDRSMRLYNTLHARNPGDIVPLREQSRTAMWAGKPALAEAALERILHPGVDTRLRERLENMKEKGGWEPHIRTLSGTQSRRSDSEAPFLLYENLHLHFMDKEDELPENLRTALRSVLLELLPLYRWQKVTWLEHHAKKLVYEGKLRTALPVYRELLDLEPGNQEALFDYAQINCRMGLCRTERDAYERLLRISPAHDLAARALERRKKRSRPAVGVRHFYWKEEGRDELSGMTRDRSALTLEWPLQCNHILSLTKNRYAEKPHLRSGRVSGWGQEAELESVFNRYLRTELGLARKRYSGDGPTHTGYARAFINAKDAAEFGFGYERQTEYSNLFALKRDTHSNRWWLSAGTHLTGELGVGARTQYIEYTDDNYGRHHSAHVSYRFSDFPRIFRATLRGDMRHTTKENEYVFDGGELEDIIHPYWTPRHYRSAALTLNWRHDISEFFFCGSAQNYYDLELTGGLPSDNNNYIQLGAAWHYEFAPHFTLHVQGRIYRSGDWDSDSLTMGLKKRF